MRREDTTTLQANKILGPKIPSQSLSTYLLTKIDGLAMTV